MKTRIYPIFLPHAGCPFQCVYCDQRAVTGAGSEPGHGSGVEEWFERQLAALIETASRTPGPGEIAFYGGTFTALPQAALIGILDRAALLTAEGRFSGIRFSTRPDALSAEVCRVLKRYPLRTVELGAQSLSDHVLAASRRGYTAQTVREAASRVHDQGWTLGVQLMPGLPGDNRAVFHNTVADTVALGPAFVRLYPTVVLRGTVLAKWLGQGRYRALDLEEALMWCADALDAFEDAGIAVARMGLHADALLARPGTVMAGPLHPAFGYLVRVRRWRDRVDAALAGTLAVAGEGGQRLAAAGGEWLGAGGLATEVPTANGRRKLAVHVAERLVSEVRGPGRGNVHHWQARWRLDEIRVVPEPQWSANEWQWLMQ